MLEASELNVFYGESHVLHDARLRVETGQVVCLLGRNGVGKTTFLKTLMGLLPARSGRIRLGGTDITSRPPYERARLGLGYSPQGREIIPSLTVRENILLGLEARGIRKREVPDAVLQLFPMLENFLEKRGGDLSGGQQQQLAIARALATRPRVLLLDEPTEGIQPSIILEIKAAIQKIKAGGETAILLVEQYLAFVRSVADRFYVMEKGSITAEGDIGGLTDDVVRKHLVV
ncbi:MAG: urea ABC transporter ATP-binding subunit UrtE [Nitrospirae bacterium]|nr:urea ABC transporter ATP-binding subunit UrtE [Nitrospirota bacterium]